VRKHRKIQQAQDREILELKARVQPLMGQLKGKRKASDLTPEVSPAGVGNPPLQPSRWAAGASGGGGDPDEKGKGSGRTPEEYQNGRQDERPAPQPENEDEDEGKQFALISHIMANAME